MEYTIVDYKGQPARLYPDGAIRNDKGHILEPGNMGKDSIITAETARDYHKLRKEKILRAVEAGVMRVTDAPNPAEAIGHIVAKRAQIAMSDDTRTGNDAARIVLQAMDALQDKAQENTVTTRHEYTIDPETLRIVEALARARRDGAEIITGKIIE